MTLKDRTPIEKFLIWAWGICLMLGILGLSLIGLMLLLVSSALAPEGFGGIGLAIGMLVLLLAVVILPVVCLTTAFLLLVDLYLGWKRRRPLGLAKPLVTLAAVVVASVYASLVWRAPLS